MELTIEKQQFLRGLARTHGVADRKSSMHILSNVLLTAEGPGSSSLVRDGPLPRCDRGRTRIDQRIRDHCRPPRTLFDIVKNLPDGEVTWKLSATATPSS